MRTPEFWNHKTGSLSAPLTRALLTPLSWLVTLVGRGRQRAVKSTRAPVPVICLGNVTLGGTGKTPLAITLGRMLQEAGHSPAFLTRGYGGQTRGSVLVDALRHSARDVGDEALLLARIAPVIVARDRVVGAQLAAAQGASVIIMDDGFQNPHLFKDFSLLVLETGSGLGNGRVFPAGPLREPLADALGRADAVIAMGEGRFETVTNLPILSAQLLNLAPPPGGSLIAFAGIGRPGKFFDALRAGGAELKQEISFDDHHVYSATEVASLHNWAAKEKAKLITTEKDFVRLRSNQRDNIEAWPVEARFANPETLMAMLAQVLSS